MPLRKLILLVPLLFLMGCRHAQLIEAELRYQNNRVYELETLLAQRDAEIHTLQAQLAVYQVERPCDDCESSSCKPGADCNSPTAEGIYKCGALSQIVLGSLTGGRNPDECGVPTGFAVMVIPQDYDGDAFKCPGNAEVTLYQKEKNGRWTAIGTWEIGPAEIRKSWRSSLLGSGYQWNLPWQQMPTSPSLKVVVQFITLDGRVFDAEREFEVKLTGTPAPRDPSAWTRPSGRPMDYPTIEGCMIPPGAVSEEVIMETRPTPQAIPRSNSPAPMAPSSPSDDPIMEPWPSDSELERVPGQWSPRDAAPARPAPAPPARGVGEPNPPSGVPGVPERRDVPLAPFPGLPGEGEPESGSGDRPEAGSNGPQSRRSPYRSYRDASVRPASHQVGPAVRFLQPIVVE